MVSRFECAKPMNRCNYYPYYALVYYNISVYTLLLTFYGICALNEALPYSVKRKNSTLYRRIHVYVPMYLGTPQDKGDPLNVFNQPTQTLLKDCKISRRPPTNNKAHGRKGGEIQILYPLSCPRLEIRESRSGSSKYAKRLYSFFF